MATTDSDPVVDHPTWFGQIRNFFTETDIAHMGAKGIDLGSYNGVVANAISIYSQTQGGSMPPGDATKWSANRVQTFLNWITDNYPVGTPTPPARAALVAAAPAPRMRKEVSALSADEVTTLKKAFAGILGRDPQQGDSYFAIAGVHWFPAIDQNPLFHCLHHENRFLPWHRFHLRRFEDALRTVPGCANVTLPYWDVTKPIPALLYEEPFAEYKLQAPIGHNYDPLTTKRNTPAQIAANMAAYNVAGWITNALKQSFWEQFNRTFWQAHDSGHVACGPTMANQDISAFDPVFWFFHCNLDRIWLQWQKSVGATTVAKFKSVCQTSTAWLDVPALGAIPPFTGTAADTITYSEVDYAPPPGAPMALIFENKSGNVAAAKSFRIDSAAPLSVRVKDINRAGIPGTFVVHLLADGKEVARQAFFQPTDPGICPNCSENSKVSLDFHVEPEKILDKQLSVELHVPSQAEMGTRFPLSKAGQPTINVRHLIEGD
ncbi:MAG TPA: tyrosinase family protein [Reyranella sp.]|nr:tyrosinase family protein [Reyranella sp.]